ncbi:hypothetical protein, partial [Providencia stuartii]|uniref:hypothetical protein n=1 Tax=Providencia stuartii TaxID=588 RepID=UPI002989F3A4
SEASAILWPSSQAALPAHPSSAPPAGAGRGLRGRIGDERRGWRPAPIAQASPRRSQHPTPLPVERAGRRSSTRGRRIAGRRGCHRTWLPVALAGWRWLAASIGSASTP